MEPDQLKALEGHLSQINVHALCLSLPVLHLQLVGNKVRKEGCTSVDKLTLLDSLEAVQNHALKLEIETDQIVKLLTT